MSNDSMKPLWKKRLETFQVLLKATKEGRVEWERLGEDGFVAQPGKLAVSFKRNYGPEYGETYAADVTSNAGTVVDNFSVNTEHGKIFTCMKELFLSASQDIERRVGENLDELVESLRA